MNGAYVWYLSLLSYDPVYVKLRGDEGKGVVVVHNFTGGLVCDVVHQEPIAHLLRWTKNTEATNMCIFAIHVI